MLARRARRPGRMPMAHALARAARCVQGTLRAAEGGKTSRSGNDAKGVRAKFRYGVARSEQNVVLNFDLTPFAAKQDLPATNHMDPRKCRAFAQSPRHVAAALAIAHASANKLAPLPVRSDAVGAFLPGYA